MLLLRGLELDLDARNETAVRERGGPPHHVGVLRTRDPGVDLLPSWPAAWNHRLVSTRGVMVAWGAVAAVAAGVALARIGGSQWALIALAPYAAGVWTTAVQPANRAASALLAVGCVGLTWAVLSAVLTSRLDADPALRVGIDKLKTYLAEKLAP